MKHGEIMHLATLAAEIRASDTAEFYAGRRVSERNYKEALATLSAAVAEQARRAACFDELVAAMEDVLPFIDDACDAHSVFAESAASAVCRVTVANVRAVQSSGFAQIDGLKVWRPAKVRRTGLWARVARVLFSIINRRN